MARETPRDRREVLDRARIPRPGDRPFARRGHDAWSNNREPDQRSDDAKDDRQDHPEPPARRRRPFECVRWLLRCVDNRPDRQNKDCGDHDNHQDFRNSHGLILAPRVTGSAFLCRPTRPRTAASTPHGATCRGDGTAYSLGHDHAGWYCNCPARTRCAHLYALGLVLNIERSNP